jgi:hypothetical protein
MKKLTLISYQEGKCGFHEDDWQLIRTISSEKELLKGLKEAYLTDARNRSQYPLNGHPVNFILTNVDYSEYEGETYLGGGYHDDSFEPDCPDLRYIEDEIDINEFDDIFKMVFY